MVVPHTLLDSCRALAAAWILLGGAAIAQGGKPAAPSAPKAASPLEAKFRKEVESNRGVMEGDVEDLDADLGQRIGLVGARGFVISMRAPGERADLESAVVRSEMAFFEFAKELGFADAAELWADELGPAEFYLFRNAAEFQLARERNGKGPWQSGRFLPLLRGDNKILSQWWKQQHYGQAATWSRGIEEHQALHFLGKFAGIALIERLPYVGGLAPSRDEKAKEGERRSLEKLDWILEGMSTYCEVRFLKSAQVHCISEVRSTGVGHSDDDKSHPEKLVPKVASGERSAKTFQVLARLENSEMDAADAAKCWSLVDLLMRDTHRTKFVQCLRLRKELSWETSFGKAFGWTWENLESEWRAAVGVKAPEKKGPPKKK